MTNATAVAAMLADTHDRPFLASRGPVTSGATVELPLRELTARATLHGQRELADALIGALVALDRFRVPAVAA